MLSFTVGSIYFSVGYADVRLTHPVIYSYEYVGVNDYPPDSPEQRVYVFKILNHFDENEEGDDPVFMFLNDEDAVSLKNIDGLIGELEERRDEWKRLPD